MNFENPFGNNRSSAERLAEKLGVEEKKRAISRVFQGYKEFEDPNFSIRSFFPEVPEEVY